MAQFFRPLIPLSLTDPDEGLLRYASMLVRLFGWDDVHFVHVAPADRPAAWDPRPPQDAMRAEVDRVLGQPASPWQPTFHAARGSRVDEILRLAVDNGRDLILLGHRRTSSGRRSVARHLAMISPCSVWLVPEGAPPTIGEILAPTDFSADSADSLSVAISIARTTGLNRLRALHVFFDPSTVQYAEYVDELVGQEESAFKKFLAGVDTGGVEVESIFQESSRPARAIVRVAETCRADLIVMNTRGRSRAASVLLGSTTSETMAATTVPLLAVKHHGSRMRLLEALLSHRVWERQPPKTG